MDDLKPDITNGRVSMKFAISKSGHTDIQMIDEMSMELPIRKDYSMGDTNGY